MVGCLTTFALADNNDDLNFSLSMDCQFGRYCDANTGFAGEPAQASADFSSGIGQPFTFNATTASTTDWLFNGDFYEATFGYGGTFTMSGPDGLTFTGVVTSGYAHGQGKSWQVQVNYFGEWSNGVYASGDAFVDINNGGHDTQAHLDSQVAPEPSTFLLFGSGLVGIVGLRKRFF
jgi:PEP-CTERM motif